MGEDQWLYILYDDSIIEGKLCKTSTGFTRDFKEAISHLIKVRDSFSILGHVVIIHGEHSFFINTLPNLLSHAMYYH